MMIHVIANLGIIILNIYLLFKISKGSIKKEDLSNRHIFLYTTLQTIVGILLMIFSEVVLDTRIDFRFLLYAISMKYLGGKVTLSTIFLVTLTSFFFNDSIPAMLNLTINLLMMVTLPFVCKWAEKTFDDLGQWFILITYSLLLPIISMVYSSSDTKQIIYISMALSGSSYLLAFISYRIIRDLQNVVQEVNTDSLTQLHNARKFQEDIERLEKYGTACSVILMDIDFFKRFNDLFGHATGNLVLKEISKVLSKQCGKMAQFYRVGGEEFVVLIMNNDLDNAARLAEKIQEDLHALSILLDDGKVITVTVSMGVTSQKKDEYVKDSIERADKAMYQAKNNGRNQIVIDRAN